MRWLVAAVLSVTLLSATAPAGGSEALATLPCRPHVRTGVLPEWARAGFVSPRPRIPHALGRSGEIAAVLFAYPLRSPPAQDRNNKILWVSRRPRSGAALWIRAEPMDGARVVGPPVRRIVPGGPGPSLVDLPSPGCWRLTLTWSGRRDSLDLRYLSAPSG